MSTFNQSFSKKSDDTASVESSPYIFLSQESTEEDAATVGEVADAIDEILAIDPCDETEEASEDSYSEDSKEDQLGSDVNDYKQTLPKALEDTTEEEITDVLYYLFNDKMPEIGGCDAFNRVFLVYIRVYRSDMSKPYTLDLTGGEVINKEIVERTKSETIVLSNANSISFENPVAEIKTIDPTTSVISPSGTGGLPSYSINENTITFSETITTTLNVTYLEQYELLTIKLPNTVDKSYEDVVLTAYYLGLMESLTTDYASSTDDNSDICSFMESFRVKDKPSDGLNCQQREIVHMLCSCSGSETDSKENITNVSCPEGQTSGFVPEVKESSVYVTCPDEVEQLHEPEYYIDKCCKSPDFTLPRCKETRRSYFGGAQIEKGEKYWKEKYGKSVRLIPVSPEDGVCGEYITSYDVKANNCCDEAVPLEWDEENSASVAPDYSSVLLYFLGGREEVNVSIRGQGFWLDSKYTLKDGVITNNNGPYLLTAIRVYTEDACGRCLVTIDDGCSTAELQLRSTNGQWVDLNLPPFTCLESRPSQIGAVWAYSHEYYYFETEKYRYLWRVPAQSIGLHQTGCGRYGCRPGSEPFHPEYYCLPLEEQTGNSYCEGGASSGTGYLYWCTTGNNTALGCSQGDQNTDLPTCFSSVDGIGKIGQGLYVSGYGDCNCIPSSNEPSNARGFTYKGGYIDPGVWQEWRC